MIRAFVLAAIVASPASSPQPPISVDGMFVRPNTGLDAAEWARLPHVQVKATDHDGKSGEYDGVRLADLLQDLGAPIGDAVRGKAARAYVVVTAADKYAAIFALAELETNESRCAPLLADSRDHAALPNGVGPISIVAPCDRTHARWVREVTKLTVVITSDS